MDGDRKVIWGQFPGSRRKVAWREAYPRGPLYPFAIKPDCSLNQNDFSQIEQFCDLRFGQHGYFIAQGFAYIAFRSESHLNDFLVEFGEGIHALIRQEKS